MSQTAAIHPRASSRHTTGNMGVIAFSAGPSLNSTNARTMVSVILPIMLRIGCHLTDRFGASLAMTIPNARGKSCFSAIC